MICNLFFCVCYLCSLAICLKQQGRSKPQEETVWEGRDGLRFVEALSSLSYSLGPPPAPWPTPQLWAPFLASTAGDMAKTQAL